MKKTANEPEKVFPYEGIANTLIRLVKRTENLSPEQEEAIKNMVNELGEIELKGGLCIEWNNSESHEKDLKLIISSGLLSPIKNQVHTPFVLDESSENLKRIYSLRNFFIEKQLGDKFATLFKYERPELKNNVAYLEKFKPPKDEDKDKVKVKYLTEEQYQAAANATKRSFAVITGGPGTGKTTTVAKYLESALSGDPEAEIVLCAPTGKAQSRLNEDVISQMNDSPEDYKRLNEANRSGRLRNMTIHKLLVTNLSDGNKPDKDHPLECDILVVDEGSMIDVPLGLKLLNVINPKKTQVLFLGDKNQLAAVGPGSLFSDISDKNRPLRDSVGELTENHRFTDDSTIGNVAKMLATADSHDKTLGDTLLEILQNKSNSDLTFHDDNPSRLNGLSPSAKVWLNDHLEKYSQEVIKRLVPGKPNETDLEELWEVLSGFKPIAAQRQGLMSLSAINRYSEEFIRKEVNAEGRNELYNGKVIIVRKNDPNLGVSNGDVAFIYKESSKDPEGNPVWWAYIGDLKKKIRAQLLPEYDVAFGITIHQSQGSGFDDVAVFLPTIEGDSKNLATRELLYTAITRARKNCQIFGTKEAFKLSVDTITSRTGGLSDRISEALKQ